MGITSPLPLTNDLGPSSPLPGVVAWPFYLLTRRLLPAGLLSALAVVFRLPRYISLEGLPSFNIVTNTAALLGTHRLQLQFVKRSLEACAGLVPLPLVKQRPGVGLHNTNPFVWPNMSGIEQKCLLFLLLIVSFLCELGPGFIGRSYSGVWNEELLNV